MPTQIKQKKSYYGFARSILVEDDLTNETPGPYDILDDLGQAYIMSTSGAEVKTTPFEGKQVFPHFFRVASFPKVKKEDLIYIRGLEDYAKKEAREAVQKQEDGRLLTLLNASISDYSEHPTHVVSPNHVFEVGKGNPIDQHDFNQALNAIKLHEIDPYWVLVNPVEASELRSYVDLDGCQLLESVMVPEGTVFITPDKNYLGVMPTLFGITEEEHHPSELEVGWVVDELIGMLILNPRGLAVIRKV
jgi:hypothetical protein